MVNAQILDTQENRTAGTIASALANPAPLGLMGFGMTTVLLNLLNGGLIASSGIGMILAVGIFYGGIAQIIAGAMEFRKGNTFGMVAFTSYGMFWISLVAILVFPDAWLGAEAGRRIHGGLPGHVGIVHRVHVRGDA